MDGSAKTSISVTRRWLLSGTAVGIGVTIVPHAASAFALEVTSHGQGDDKVAITGGVQVVAGSATLPGIALALSGSNPNATYPPPLYIVNLPPAYQPGDTLRLFYDAGPLAQATGTTFADHVLTDGDAAGSAINFGATITSMASGIHTFQMQGLRGSAVSPLSNTVVHGDTVAPLVTVVGGTRQTVADEAAVAIAVKLNKAGTVAVTGIDAPLFHVSRVGATSFVVHLVDNKVTDRPNKANYAFNIIGTDLSGNSAAPIAETLTVNASNRIPDIFTFLNATNVALGTTSDSADITVSGLDSGVHTNVTVRGCLWSKNGGAFTSAAGTAVNGDKVRLRVTAPSNVGQAAGSINIGGVAVTYTVSTPGFAATTTWITDTPQNHIPTQNGKTMQAGSHGTCAIFRTTSGIRPREKKVFEVTGAAFFGFVGEGDKVGNNEHFGFSDTSLNYGINAEVYANKARIGKALNFSLTDAMLLVFDRVTNKFYVLKNGVSFYGDPVAGTGGADISFAGSAILYPAAELDGGTAIITRATKPPNGYAYLV